MVPVIGSKLSLMSSSIVSTSSTELIDSCKFTVSPTEMMIKTSTNSYQSYQIRESEKCQKMITYSLIRDADEA